MKSEQAGFSLELTENPILLKALDLVGGLSTEQFGSWVHEIRRSYLSARLLGKQVRNDTYEEILDKLTRVAFVVEDLAVDVLCDEEFPEQDSDLAEALKLAGLVFEYVGDLTPKRHSSVRAYNWYLHSSICYSLGHYEANSAVLAGRIEQKARKILNTSSEDRVFEHFLLEAQYGILLFLARSIHMAKQRALAATDRASIVLAYIGHNEAGDDVILPNSFFALRGFTEIANFICQSAAFLLAGDQQAKEDANTHLAEAISVFTDAGMSFESWLCDRLEFIFGQMTRRSIWTQLAILKKKRPRYLEALVSDREHPIVELWPSQIEALSQIDDQGADCGVLGDGQTRYVITMPTSSGKTRIAEIIIANAIGPQGSSACVYVAPTKALVNQVEADLDKVLGGIGYRVATAVGAYESVPGLDEVIIEDCDVLVTTPEKLDMLVRQGSSSIVNQASLFIFDECHKVEDAGRGLRLELLISRLLYLHEEKGTQFVVLSAVMPHSNLSQFVSWLEGKHPIEFHWRPTRLLEGVVERHCGQPEYVVHYPTLFDTEILVKGSSLNRWDIAARLALRYVCLGPVLIYCPTKSRAQSIARRFVKSYFEKRLAKLYDTESMSSSKRDLTELIEDRLGLDFPLKELVRVGVAYHHADLPNDVKIAIEQAVRDEEIRILASTTTLAEGVNLPVRTVIFADILYTFRDLTENKQKIGFQIDPKQFRNIAGRAGRALYDTEGHAILVDFYELQTLYSGNKYGLDQFEVKSGFWEVIQRLTKESPRAGTQVFYLGKDAVDKSPVRSRFFDLTAAIQSKRRETDSLQADTELQLEGDDIKEAEEERFHQSEVLALVCDRDQKEPFVSISSFLTPSPPTEEELARLAESAMDRTLFAQQVDQDEKARKLFGEAVHLTKRHAFMAYQISDTEKRALYNQTGLSIPSCRNLEEFVKGIADRFGAGDYPAIAGLRIEGKLELTQMEELLGCVQIAVETQPKKTEEKLGIKTSHERVLFDWITGKSVPEILKDNFGVVDGLDQSKVEDRSLKGANYIYSQIVNYASWALGATVTFLAYQLEQRGIDNFDPEIRLLPAYALYGVDSPVAVFCMAMGINDRDVARDILAPRYPANLPLQSVRAIPDWNHVKWWFTNLERSTLEHLIPRSRKLRATWDVVMSARRRFSLPEHIEDSEYYLTTCPVRGLPYEDRLSLLPELYAGYSLVLEREVHPEDPNAIRILLQDNRLLGYVPRELAEDYAPLMDSGIHLYAQVAQVQARRVLVHIFSIEG